MAFKTVELVLWTTATLAWFAQVSDGANYSSSSSSYVSNRPSSTSTSCQDGLDTAECLEAVRSLMASEDRFWFGSSYQFACGFPYAYLTPGCFNGDTNHLSIVTRMRESNDSSVDVIQQVLNVTFDVPAGSYEACGNTYQVPTFFQTVNPTQTTPIPLWSADHLPSVSWTSEADKTYALIVWDAGSLFLHSAMYNIHGSNLDNAQTAKNYNGPKNSADRDQPYVFLLYEQQEEIDRSNITSVIVAALSESINLTPNKLVRSLHLTGPVGVSVLTVGTDPYSAEFMKNNRIVNNCPALTTEKFAVLGLVSISTTGVQLKSSVDVTFTSEDIDVTSCCRNVTFAANSRSANPIGKGYIPPVYTRHAPTVTLVPPSFFDTYYYFKPRYTLLLLDISDELAGASLRDTRLHWQVVNIQEGDVTSGQTTKTYKAPLPLAGRRTMLFLLLKQSTKVNASSLHVYTGRSCPPFFSQRCYFDLGMFVRNLDMSVEGASWFVTSPDAYSRQRTVADNLQTEKMACRLVAGYSSPCPSPAERCQTAGSEVRMHAPLRTVILVVVLGLLLRCFSAV